MTARRTRSLEEAKAAAQKAARALAEMNLKGWTTLDVAYGVDIAPDGSYAVRANVRKLGAGASQIPKSVNDIAVVVRETGPVKAFPVQPLVNCVERGAAFLQVAVDSLARKCMGRAGIVSISEGQDADGGLVLEALSNDPDLAKSILPDVWQGIPVVVRESGDIVPYANDDEVEWNDR